MKLIIKREQQKKTGFFGGHKGMSFLLSCRVELTEEESGLISKYKAEGELLTTLEAGEKAGPQIIYISSLMSGVSFEHKDVTELLAAEDKIKNVCNNFKTLLMVMSSFGGEEVIDY